MKNKINLVSETIDKNDINLLVEWLQQTPTPRLTKGEQTIKFEKKWSDYLGSKHSVFVNSGSSAILLALAALREKGLRNDKVVVPTLSWLTDVSSVMQLGMTPILCDCNMDDLALDLDELERIITAEKPSVVILVSVLGLVPDMERIVKLCKENDVYLIEDVCESMGSAYKGQKLGTFGDISLFSLYYGHHLSTIEGGLVCTSSEALYDLCISLRSHGWDRDWSAEKQKAYREKHGVSSFDALYTFYYPGFNLRSTDLQAFLGLNQIDKLDTFKTNRSANFKHYKTLLIHNELKLDFPDSHFISNFAYPYLSVNRQKIVERLIDYGVEVRPLIAGSMGRKPFWTSKYGETPMKNADRISKFGFYLPNHQDLTIEEITAIANIINQAENE